jgi:hypothetical protein
MFHGSWGFSSGKSFISWAGEAKGTPGGVSNREFRFDLQRSQYSFPLISGKHCIVQIAECLYRAPHLASESITGLLAHLKAGQAGSTQKHGKANSSRSVTRLGVKMPPHDLTHYQEGPRIHTEVAKKGKSGKQVRMHRKYHDRPPLIAVAVMLASLLACSTAGSAQLGGLLPLPGVSAVTGQATAVRATVLGILGTVTTTVLSDTGNLGGTNDVRGASQLTAGIPALLGAEALHAATIGLPNEVDSEASLANLGLNVAGIGISADMVMARASRVSGALGSGASSIDNLAINGVPVAVTGQPNQTVAIPGGQIVINEQTISPGSTTVNALHVIVNGVTDVVIASAAAGIS